MITHVCACVCVCVHLCTSMNLVGMGSGWPSRNDYIFVLMRFWVWIQDHFLLSLILGDWALTVFSSICHTVISEFLPDQSWWDNSHWQRDKSVTFGQHTGLCPALGHSLIISIVSWVLRSECSAILTLILSICLGRVSCGKKKQIFL